MARSLEESRILASIEGDYGVYDEMMKELLTRLKAGEDLEARDGTRIAEFLLNPESGDDFKAEILKALADKGETALEIASIAEVFLERSLNPDLNLLELDGPTLDIVGTGGDRLNLFNVSTTSMFVAAGAGAVVTKHGNRGISSKSGGADVLEALGIGLDLGPDDLRRCVDDCGIGFLFAPNFHPAFRNVTSLRRQLAEEGVRTIFNLLGPLLNPARPQCQLIGVSEAKWTPIFAEISQRLGRESVWVVHGETGDGASVDELSTMGSNLIWKAGAYQDLQEEEIVAADFGFEKARLEHLVGGEPTDNADILTKILTGEDRGAKRDMVLLNAGAAIAAAGLSDHLEQGIEKARISIDSGKAFEKLERLQAWCRAKA